MVDRYGAATVAEMEDKQVPLFKKYAKINDFILLQTNFYQNCFKVCLSPNKSTSRIQIIYELKKNKDERLF